MAAAASSTPLHAGNHSRNCINSRHSLEPDGIIERTDSSASSSSSWDMLPQVSLPFYMEFKKKLI